jgi:hypothetical protein
MLVGAGIGVTPFGSILKNIQYRMAKSEGDGEALASNLSHSSAPLIAGSLFFFFCFFFSCSSANLSFQERRAEVPEFGACTFTG